MDDFLSTIAKLTGNKSLVSEPKIDVNPILDRMRDSVVTQESGGRQKIKNPRTGATGLFQVLPSNIPDWTQKYLGKRLTPEQYASDPDAQEKVFRGEMGRYLEKALRTSPDEDTAIRKAAAAWYGGEGAMHRYDDPKRFRPDEPSFQEYTNSILGRLKQKPQTDTPDFLSSLQDLTKDLGGEDFLSRIQKIAPSPTNPVNPPKINVPAPEAPETIQSQIQSTLDPNSPKKGTLITPGEQIPTLGGLQVIDVPEGKLAVNPAKGQPRSLADAIGKVQDVGNNTRGMTVYTTDAQGNELSASIVRDPKAAAEQVKLDKQMYPQAVNHELLPSDEVARRRNEQLARSLPSSLLLPNEMPETPESIRANQVEEGSPESLTAYNTFRKTNNKKGVAISRTSNLQSAVPRQGIKASKPQQVAGQAEAQIGEDNGFDAIVNPSEGDNSFTSIKDQAAAQLAKYAQVEYDTARQYVDQMNLQGLSGGKYDPNARLDPSLADSLKGRQISINFTPVDIKRVQAFNADVARRKAQSELDFARREKGINQDELDAAGLELEEFRLKTLADADNGLITHAQAAEAYEKLKADIDAWRQDTGILGNEKDVATQKAGLENAASFLGENLASSQAMQPFGQGERKGTPDIKKVTPQQVKAYRDQAYNDIKQQYGSISNYVEQGKAFAKRMENKPMFAIAKGVETAAGGLAKVPFEATAALLKAAAIGDEAVGRLFGADIDAQKNWKYKLGQDIKDLADAVPIDKDYKGSIPEILGNTTGQVVLQAFVGAPTGGVGSFLIGGTMGGVDAYEEAKKGGATNWEALGATAAAGILAGPDIFIFGGEKLAPFLRSFKTRIVEGLVARGIMKEAAEKAAITATNGFFDTLIEKQGLKKVIGYAGKNVGTGLAEGAQEISENVGNHAYAYLTYDPTPERWNKLTDLFSKENVISGVAGFFGGLVGAGLAELSTRAQNLSPEARVQAQELLPKFQPYLSAQDFANAKKALTTVNETKAPTPQKPAPVAQTPLAKDTPVESKAEPKSVESLLKYYEEAPTDLIPEAPLRPSTLEGAKNRIKEVEEQRDVARREAETSPLSGLPNKRAFDKALSQAEKDPNTSVVFFDLDQFKAYNDAEGQQKGDALLKKVADAVNKAKDEVGVARENFHFGGDEFAALPPTDKAEQFLKRAQEIFGEVRVGDKVVSLTGGIGQTFREAEKNGKEAKKARKIEIGKREGLTVTDREGNILYQPEESKKANPVQNLPTKTKTVEETSQKVTTKEEGGNIPRQDKQPWEMSREEFAKTATVKRQQPEVPFEQWAKENGYPEQVADETDKRHPNGISNKALKDKQNRLDNNLALRMEAREKYNALVESGKIKTVTRESTANTDNESDLASTRIQHKRAVKQALSEGKPVPPEVLADYPDLAPKQSAKQRMAEKATQESVKAESKPQTAKKTEKPRYDRESTQQLIEGVRKEIDRLDEEAKKYDPLSPSGRVQIQRIRKEQNVYKRDLKGYEKDLKQYQTVSDVPVLPKSQQVSPKAEPTAKEAKESVKDEKVNPRTGLTKTQTEYLAKELRDLAIDALKKNIGHDDAGFEQMLLHWKPDGMPESVFGRSGIEMEESIKVPGDGSFKVNSVEAANRLHQKITGQPIEGLGRASKATVPSFRPQFAPSTAASNDQEMLALRLYGTPERAIAFLTEQREQLSEKDDAKALKDLDGVIEGLKEMQGETISYSGEPLTTVGKEAKATADKEIQKVREGAEDRAKSAYQEIVDSLTLDIATIRKQFKEEIPKTRKNQIDLSHAGANQYRSGLASIKRQIISRENTFPRYRSKFNDQIDTTLANVRQGMHNAIGYNPEVRKLKLSDTPTIEEIRSKAQEQLATLRDRRDKAGFRQSLPFSKRIEVLSRANDILTADSPASLEMPSYLPVNARTDYEDAITDYFEGTLTDPIFVSNTNRILTKLKMPSLPILVTPKVLDKAIQGKHSDEGITADTLLKMRGDIDQPLAVLKSNNEDAPEGSLLLVLPTKTIKDTYLTVAIHPNQKIGRVEVNRIATIHARDLSKSVRSWQHQKLFRYVGGGLSRELTTTYGSNFAPVVQSILDSDPNIITESNDVNTLEMPSPKEWHKDIITDKGINYDKVNRIAEQVISGESQIVRLDDKGERGRVLGGIRNVEASIILAANERASEDAGSRTPPVKRQEQVLERYAKLADIWFDVKEFVGQQQGFISKGVEAYVHRADEHSVHKLIDYKMVDRHLTPLEFIDNRISTFNSLFPETAYELVGFTRDGEGNFRFVVKQPFIQDVVYTTPVERQTFMQNRGLSMTDRYGEAFADSLYKVSDLHEKNALIDKNGNIYVIDAVPKPKYDVEEMSVESASLEMPAPAPFFSQVERTIEQKMPNKASADQIKGLLKDAKKEELEWLDIDTFLKDNPNPTKQEVLDYVRANNAVVEEVTKGGKQATERLTELESREHLTEAEEAERQSILNGTYGPREETKFSEYTLPGGENYRELLLTMQTGASHAAWNDTHERRTDELEAKTSLTDAERKELNALYDRHRNALALTAAEPKYKSPHWDEPNVLAHVRFDERDGGKTLHVAEIQSDWGQSGRKQGYRDESARKEYEALYARNQREGLRPPDSTRMVELSNRLNGVPNMPFKTSWPLMAFKRVLRHAVENGYERVTFDTGETNAERYDLSKQVDAIRVRSFSDQYQFNLSPKTTDHDIILQVNSEGKVTSSTKSELQGKSIDDVVGKELADKLMSAEDGAVLRGNDLKVGGIGMEAFYDRILPNEINKYVKKWGARVEADKVGAAKASDRWGVYRNGEFKLDFIDLERAQNYVNQYPEINRKEFTIEKGKTAPVHSLTITPAMKDAVMAGQTLFMPADSGSFKLQEDAQFAHPQDLLDRAKSSITDDGHIELNVEAGELLRRIAGKPNAFFGLTHTRGTLIQLSRKIDQKLDEFRKVGYSDAEIKVLTDLADQLREVAKKGAGITYIFDFSLPHETHHQMVLNALNGETIPKETIDELSKLKVWNNPKIKTVTGQVTTFSRLYPRASGVTKAMEIAAMLDTGEITHADKNEFLKIFARGIKSVSTVNPDDFIRIFQYDSQTSDTGRSEAVGSEPETSGSTSEDRQASPTKEEANQEAGTRPGDGQVQRPDSGTEVSVENKVVRQLADYDRLFKKRQYAETLRENGYQDTPDVPYIPDTEKKWLEDAQRRISASKHDDYKTAEKAFYEDNMEPQQRTALGIGLLDHLGSIGELERMIKVSEELVKHVGTAAQALRASQLAGKYDFVTGMMIATRAVKKAGKELTAKDAEKVKELLTRIAQTEEEKASLNYLNSELENAVKEADKNIKELEGALAEAQAERKVDEKTIARLKRQIATLKENRPRTYHAKQKAELERAKPDLEKILREAFSLAMNAPDTDAFKSWFGDSKVVDENGKPLVVYHGTKADITEFRPTKSYEQSLIFFSRDPKMASSWAVHNASTSDGLRRNYVPVAEIKKAEAEYREKYEAQLLAAAEASDWVEYDRIRALRPTPESQVFRDTDSTVYPVYLKVENPFDPRKDYKLIEPLLKTIPSMSGILADGTHKAGNWVVYENDQVKRFIREQGYDGIYLTEEADYTGEKPHDTIAVFSPTQIKSAIGNKGTFDPNNPSILEMPADDRVHNALVDMAALDILNYVSPEDTIEHLRDLTNNMLSEDELREIHLEAFEATKTESNITPEARKNSAIRMAHRRMAMQTAKPDVQKVRERPSRYDKEVITFGRDNGYTDKEILGAILFPKIKGAHSVNEWKKLVDGDDDTFKRSRELRQKVNNDIQDQIIKAKADREGYKGDLEKFKNEVIHNGISGREARKAFDAYARRLSRSLGRKAFDLASETVSLFKGLSAWGEISYIARQGFIPLLTDTRAAMKGDWEGIGHGLQGDNEMWKFLANKAGFENAAEYLSNHSLSVFVEQIRQHPRFLSAQNNGVRFTQIGDFNVADDHFSTQLLEKVPFYRRAEVAYTLPGDLQRLYIYDNWATMLEQQNLSADEMKKALKYVAETVNAFTGKGDIGRVIAKGGALSKALNLALFSPQLLFSRFQSLNKLTLGWATAPKGLKIQMAKKGLRFYGILAVIAALTGMVIDPEDEDFGKINIGDTHADLLAGLDVPAQLYLRTAMGFVKSVINQDTAYLADDIQASIREFGVSKEGQPRFVRSKLSPGASLAVDAYTGTDFIGRPFTWWGGLTSRSVPLAWQQTYDALLYDRYREMVKEPRTFEYAVNKFNEHERNYLNALMVMAGTFTGIGITQYPKADRSKAVQLAAQLSPFVSKKDAEQRRIEGGLRNLLADKFDLLKQGKDTRKVDAEIERWMRINPDLNKKFSAINSQAGSKYGLLSLHLKDLNADQLKRVRSVSTDPGEIKIIDKRIKSIEK